MRAGPIRRPVDQRRGPGVRQADARRMPPLPEPWRPGGSRSARGGDPPRRTTRRGPAGEAAPVGADRAWGQPGATGAVFPQPEKETMMRVLFAVFAVFAL